MAGRRRTHPVLAKLVQHVMTTAPASHRSGEVAAEELSGDRSWGCRRRGDLPPWPSPPQLGFRSRRGGGRRRRSRVGELHWACRSAVATAGATHWWSVNEATSVLRRGPRVLLVRPVRVHELDGLPQGVFASGYCCCPQSWTRRSRSHWASRRLRGPRCRRRTSALALVDAQ